MLWLHQGIGLPHPFPDSLPPAHLHPLWSPSPKLSQEGPAHSSKHEGRALDQVLPLTSAWTSAQGCGVCTVRPPVCAHMLSRSVVFDSETPWTVACQASLSIGFSRQEYCSGLPLPPPGDLPDPGIKPECPALQAGSLPLCYLGSPGSPDMASNKCCCCSYKNK